MKRILLGVILSLMSVGNAHAQEFFMPEPGPMEFHNYTYQIKDDGSAKVWLRVDSVVIPLLGGEYKLTLPEKQTGEAIAWYRENGCSQYQGEMCIMYGENTWKQAKLTWSGKELSINIPKRSVLKPQDDQSITLGISWTMSDITSKKWWGREVEAITAKVGRFVPSLAVGVYFPDGVYFRDKLQGPSGWGQVVSEMMSKDSAMMAAPQMNIVGGPTMFDTVGGGAMNRFTNNLLPGEDYRFKVMTSTSAWKLYVKEILWGMVWILTIALVLTTLLFMVIGRRSFFWYGGVVVLFSTLLMLSFGLILSYNFSFGGGNEDYFRPVLKDTGVVEQQENGMPAPEATEVVSEPEMSVESK